jgi:flagellar hook-length control protein FliK
MIFPAIPEVLHRSDHAAGRQSLPHRQLLPVFLRCVGACAFQKAQQNRGTASGPAFASGTASKDFFAHHHRIIRVRASATSRTASASHYVAQAKADANKAGETSPFTLLMESAAAAAKPSKKDTQDSADKPADDKPMANQDDKAAATPPPPAGKPPAKPEKSDKDKNPIAAKTGDEAPDDSQIAAADLQLLNPQAPPPVPPAQMPIVTPPAKDKAEGIRPGVAAAAAPAAAKPSPDLQIDADMSAAKTANAAAQVPAQSDDSQVEESQTPETAATQPDAKTRTSGEETSKSVKTAATGKPMDDAGGAATSVESAKAESAKTDSGKSDIARDEAAKSAAANDDIPGIGVPRSDIAKARAGKDAGKEDVTKGYAGRSGGAKGHVAQDNVAKSDPRNDTGKTLSSDLPPVEAPANSSTAKAAPPPVQPASLGIDSVAAPQTVLPSQANSHAITQHVQVSAQPAPNVPALAVEIAAKSQSGAKQFDIRLDPAELGRVEVRLSIDATGKASAHLSADQPQTLTLLQKDAPILVRALREAGLDVSQDGLNFSLRQQTENQNGNTGNNGRRGSSRAFPLAASISIDATAGSAAYRGVANGRLDIRV